jgi:hypothetical protein
MEARQAAHGAIADYFRRTGEPARADWPSSFVVAGHQPELFHPGVWVKNFALNGLARQGNATPLNLLIDSDIAKVKGLHVPVLAEPAGDSCNDRTRHAVRLAFVPFGHSAAEEPFEEHPVADEKELAGFPGRLQDALGGWGFQPLVEDFWKEVIRQAAWTPLLGERFAAARRTFERRWGCHNAELPVSWLCQTEPYAWFACHLLSELPRFHSIYNASVQEYRRRHGLRSRNHPVPDLGAADDWLESPFWAWRTGQRRRGRLFVRRTMERLELRAGSESWPSLPAPRDDDGGASVSAWLELAHEGFKIRSRALTNTLFARMFLGDLFVHGIGGGKYDEVTDEIIRPFYGMEPPAYLVISATLLLPLSSFDVRSEDRRQLAATLRDLQYNPQRHLPELADAGGRAARELATQKQAWIAREPGEKRERKERFRKLRSLNHLLQPFLKSKDEGLQAALVELDAKLHANAILQRRDYAFCLFPEQKLKPFCTQFLSPRIYGPV